MAPVWAVGAFILAVGFLAVPTSLLDPKKVLGQTRPRVGLHWGHIVGATSRLISSSGTHAIAAANTPTAPEPAVEGHR